MNIHKHRNAEMTIVVQDDKIVRARDQDGAEIAGRVESDRLHWELINVFSDLLSEKVIKRRRELEVFGSLLYRTLFSGEVGAFFERTRAKLKPGERLRVQLSFQEAAAELAALPWEYLYCPDLQTKGGFFLSTRVDLVLSRYLPLSEGRQNLTPADSPLRILIIVSKPKDLGPVIDAPVISAVKELKDVSVEVLEDPTVMDYLEKLNETRPHVLHFIGHSRFNKAEMQGEIALLKDDYESVQWVMDRVFTELFTQIGVKPQLVLLHSCEGAAVDFKANFAGLAPQLIRAGIPAVVAMQYPIKNKAAISFSKAFYRELAKGAPVDHAVQTGRWTITLDHPDPDDTGDFGTPVLYMHSLDGDIGLVRKMEKEPIPAEALPARPVAFERMETRVVADNQEAPVEPVKDSFGPRSAGLETETGKHLPRLSVVFLEIHLLMNQRNLSFEQKEAMKVKLSAARLSLSGKTVDECRDLLTELWDQEPDDVLKEIWLAMVEKMK